MNYIGVDLHKQNIVVALTDQAHQHFRLWKCPCRDTAAIAAWFAARQPFEVVVEATASYEWFLQLVEPFASRVRLAHPGKLRVIAESTRKSDKIDARVLAEFLARDMIPTAHRATPYQREYRQLVRYRHRVQGRITSLKCRIRRILADYNADRKDLFTKVGRAYVQQLKLLDADRFVLDELWCSLDHHRARLRAATLKLREFVQNAPPAEQRARQRLASVPGVGAVTINVFLAEVADVRRFSSQKKLTAYAGLAPGFRSSAGRVKELGIERTGSRLLRWALVEAAWRLTYKDPHWRNIFERLAQRRGKKKAIVAVARRLLCLLMAVVVNDRQYGRTAAPAAA